MASRKTPGEARAHKRQVEMFNEDAKRLCTLDIVTPFRHLQDAVDRLIPFHLLAGTDPAAADLEELQELSAPQLLLSRDTAWATQIASQAQAVLRRIGKVQELVGRCEGELLRWPCVPLAPEHRLLKERLLGADAAELLQKEQNKPAGYITPDEDGPQGAAGHTAPRPLAHPLPRGPLMVSGPSAFPLPMHGLTAAPTAGVLGQGVTGAGGGGAPAAAAGLTGAHALGGGVAAGAAESVLQGLGPADLGTLGPADLSALDGAGTANNLQALGITQQQGLQGQAEEQGGLGSEGGEEEEEEEEEEGDEEGEEEEELEDEEEGHLEGGEGQEEEDGDEEGAGEGEAGDADHEAGDEYGAAHAGDHMQYEDDVVLSGDEAG
ncbi:hypothetical protein V8C86DRAFT_3203826 [Haematococcus lacustris]